MSTYVKTPTVFQMESTECGAASLSMIFSYFGKHLSLEQMRIETGVSRDGCNAGNIMRAAKRHGLECHAYRREPEELKKLDMPCVVHWNFNHFVVLEGFKGEYVYLNDPAIGRRKLTPEEFDDGFTGIVLTFKTTESFTKEKEKNTLWSFIRSRLAGQMNISVKFLFTGLLLVFPGLVLPVLSQLFIDDVLIKGNTNWVNIIMLIMVGMLALQVGLTLYRNLLLHKFQKKMVLLSARDFLERLFRLPISFFDQRYVGDLVKRVNNNAAVSDFLSGDLAESILNIIIAAFYIILLIVYSPILTAVALATVVINAIVVKVTSDTISTASIKLQQDGGRLSGAVCAGISISETLKASGAETEYTGRILGYHAKTIDVEQNLSKKQQIINAIPSAVKMVADMIILLLGGSYVITGKITIGMLIAFNTLFGSFSEPINKLVEFVKKIQSTKADINRVDDILNYQLDSKFSDCTAKKLLRTKLEGSVELQNITFGYSILNSPIISDFSFQMNSGSSVAFVGASGCGKSTISKIISGLYQSWEGKLLFDGIDANEIPNEVLNASVSTVSQNITLFSGTVRDNLTMWNEDVSENDMIAAAKDACIHDVISLKPGGYDYRLTEGAANLSGGQRQRLEIARALATNPTVLVMDEATSALDPVVEKQIMDNIKRRGCTCIVVAHRLSAIRDCDQIIVMEHGTINQKGTHNELIEDKGLYYQIVQNY